MNTKQQQSQIADNEFQASLQSLIDKDIIAAKYFNPSEIAYPLMEKSGHGGYQAGYKGIRIPKENDLSEIPRALKKMRMSSLLTSESTFKDKVKSGESAIAILENPVGNPVAGTGTDDLARMLTILHEVRHKAFEDPIHEDFLKTNKLNEEVLNRFLDLKAFPSLQPMIKEELNSMYEKGFDGLKTKYQPAADNFLKFFNSKSKSMLNR